MAKSANFASAQCGTNPYTKHLEGKHAHSNHSTFNIPPPDLMQPVAGALDRPMNAIRLSNRKAVIIKNVLYPPDSFSDYGTSGIGAISGRSNFKVGGRKLRKKSLLHLSTEVVEPGRGIPLPLSPNYLNVERASREATLLRMSTLLTSRSTATQMQNGEAGQNVQKQWHAARSAHICAALSSHPSMVREAVSTAQGPELITVDTGNISPAIVKADLLRQKTRTLAQKRMKFKPVLESTEEKCECPDSRHVSAAFVRADATRGEINGPRQSRGVGYAECDESATQKFDRLERERDSYIGKCETLERVLDAVYRNRDALKQELESITRRRKSLENEIVDL